MNPTHYESISVTWANVLLNLTDELDVFADDLNSLLLMFCSFRFILTLLFHLMHLIQKYVIFKG